MLSLISNLQVEVTVELILLRATFRLELFLVYSVSLESPNINYSQYFLNYSLSNKNMKEMYMIDNAMFGTNIRISITRYLHNLLLNSYFVYFLYTFIKPL